MKWQAEPETRPARSAGWVRMTGAWALAALLAACGGGNSDPCGIDPSCVSSSGSGSGSGSGGTTPVPVASDLTLVLSSASLQNGGADTVEARVTAVDANRNLLAGVPVTFSVDANATALPAGKVTDASGVLTARIGIGADRANRVITVKATAGGLAREVALQVTGVRVVGTALPATVVPGAAGSVRFRVTDINSNPLPQQTIVVSGVGGVDVTAKTDSIGEYLYAFTAPAAAGSVNISGEAVGVKTTKTVLVQAASALPAAPRTPAVSSASVSLSSLVVPVNSGNTSNQIEARALIVRTGNAPARDLRVRFVLDPAENIPGTLSTGDVLLYTDSTGVVSTNYIPGNRTSPLDGVTIRACWDYADFAVGTCPNVAKANLTVVAEPLSVSVGTDNVISFGPTGIDYQKSYLVQVNDASGAPKGDVTITAQVDLLGYFTGKWVLPPSALDWVYQPTSTVRCDNEDLNRNSINDAGEDANLNGQLDPRKADVLVSVAGSGKTDALGQAVLRLNYPQSVASWVVFRISVGAGGIGGSEGRAAFSALLPVLDAHVTSQDRVKPPPPPAFVLSPYNLDNGTTPPPRVAALRPGGEVVSLCLRP